MNSACIYMIFTIGGFISFFMTNKKRIDCNPHFNRQVEQSYLWKVLMLTLMKLKMNGKSCEQFNMHD